MINHGKEHTMSFSANHKGKYMIINTKGEVCDCLQPAAYPLPNRKRDPIPFYFSWQTTAKDDWMADTYLIPCFSRESHYLYSSIDILKKIELLNGISQETGGKDAKV